MSHPITFAAMMALPGLALALLAIGATSFWATPRDDANVIRAFGDIFQGSISAAMGGPPRPRKGACNREMHLLAPCGGWTMYYCISEPHSDGPHIGPNMEPIHEDDVVFFNRQWELING